MRSGAAEMDASWFEPALVLNCHISNVTSSVVDDDVDSGVRILLT